jgi:hypothetical protein
MTSPIRNSVAASAATVVLVGLAAVASTPACAGRQARQHYDVLIAGGTVYEARADPASAPTLAWLVTKSKQSEICGMRTRPRPFTRTASPSRLASST